METEMLPETEEAMLDHFQTPQIRGILKKNDGEGELDTSLTSAKFAASKSEGFDLDSPSKVLRQVSSKSASSAKGPKQNQNLNSSTDSPRNSLYDSSVDMDKFVKRIDVKKSKFKAKQIEIMNDSLLKSHYQTKTRP
jgi:hypothetical protein